LGTKSFNGSLGFHQSDRMVIVPIVIYTVFFFGGIKPDHGYVTVFAPATLGCKSEGTEGDRSGLIQDDDDDDDEPLRLKKLVKPTF